MESRNEEQLREALKFAGATARRHAKKVAELERKIFRLQGKVDKYERKGFTMDFTLDLHLANDKVKEYLGKDSVKADELETTIKELIYRYEKLNDEYAELEDLYSDTKKELDNTEEEFRDYKQYVEDNYKHITKEEEIDG